MFQAMAPITCVSHFSIHSAAYRHDQKYRFCEHISGDTWWYDSGTLRYDAIEGYQINLLLQVKWKMLLNTHFP